MSEAKDIEVMTYKPSEIIWIENVRLKIKKRPNKNEQGILKDKACKALNSLKAIITKKINL